jgi:hypothetical protein
MLFMICGIRRAAERLVLSESGGVVSVSLQGSRFRDHKGSFANFQGLGLY